MPTPTPLPNQVLLQVPFTTQAPLNNWAQHQESCEAANLTMVWLYWNRDPSLVIDPRTADNYIRMIDGWKSRLAQGSGDLAGPRLPHQLRPADACD